MNEMNTDGRREYDYRGGNYRDDYRYDDYHRGNYRDDYRRDYDRRGGRRNYRNYREENYYDELEECMHELKETARAIEDVAEMADNQSDRNMLMKIAQKEKEHSMHLKQMLDK